MCSLYGKSFILLTYHTFLHKTSITKYLWSNFTIIQISQSKSLSKKGYLIVQNNHIVVTGDCEEWMQYLKPGTYSWDWHWMDTIGNSLPLLNIPDIHKNFNFKEHVYQSFIGSQVPLEVDLFGFCCFWIVWESDSVWTIDWIDIEISFLWDCLIGLWLCSTQRQPYPI